METSRPALPASSHRRIVVKVGSAVIAGPAGLDPQALGNIASEIAKLRREGREVVLVSSGAVASGVFRLALAERPSTMPAKQAAAAVGQPLLMRAWEEAFLAHAINVAQVLLTAEDLSQRHRYLNARHTFETLLSWGVVPVVNENDTVMVEEIKFGDNDQLSASIAGLVWADLLVLLSDVEALFDQDPRNNPEARPVPLVERVNPEVMSMAGQDAGAVGTGGMQSKLLAAEKAQAAGIPMLLLPGARPGVIQEALAGAPVGTLFAAGNRRFSGQKLWLYQLPRPAGEIMVDAGAAKALREAGASLLPAGIREVKGSFNSGEAVRCLDQAGQLIGVGLVNYASAEIERIKGARTAEIASRLGYRHSDEVIHRDYFALVSELEAAGRG